MNSDAQRIVTVIRAMLEGSLHYLDGCLALESLRHEVGAYENDPDFIGFVAVKLAVEDLPFDFKQERSPEVFDSRYAHEIAETEAWARELTEQNCYNLLARYDH